MPEIVVICPYTTKEVRTGIEADSDTFDRLPEVLSRVNCPHCGLAHDWSRKDARLADKAA